MVGTGIVNGVSPVHEVDAALVLIPVPTAEGGGPWRRLHLRESKLRVCWQRVGGIIFLFVDQSCGVAVRLRVGVQENADHVARCEAICAVAEECAALAEAGGSIHYSQRSAQRDGVDLSAAAAARVKRSGRRLIVEEAKRQAEHGQPAHRQVELGR